MRYELNFDEDKVNDVLDKSGASYDLKGCCELLNEQQSTIHKLQDLCGKSDGENAKLRIENEKLRQSVNYWQKKYEEGTETFTFPPNCDECGFLGNNGICGYCKFTLNCYDSKEDLIDGEVLPNCPLKPLINENEQLRQQLKEKEEDERLYANEIVELRKTNEEWLEFKELGGDY